MQAGWVGQGRLVCPAAVLQLQRPASSRKLPTCAAHPCRCHLHRCSNVLLDTGLRASPADLGVAQALGSGARTALGLTLCSAGVTQQGPWVMLLPPAAAAAAAAASRPAGVTQPRPSVPPSPCPPCTAPEQLMGQRCTVAADVYSAPRLGR